MLFESVSHNDRLDHSCANCGRRQIANRRMNPLRAVRVVSDPDLIGLRDIEPFD